MINVFVSCSFLFRRLLILITICILGLLIILPNAKADTNVGGTINTDTIWTLADSPYIVTSNLTVKGT